MAELPSGTVTFLFTDIEGSTRLWQEQPGEMRPALALRSHGGLSRLPKLPQPVNPKKA